MNDEQLDILGLLAKHELTLKKIYEVFGSIFPEHKDLWQDLADDEQTHAGLFNSMRDEETWQKWLMADGRLKPAAIRSSIDFIEKHIERAQHGQMVALEALSLARDFENALLEKQFQKIINPASDTLKAALKDIIAGTVKHRQMIVDAIAANNR